MSLFLTRAGQRGRAHFPLHLWPSPAPLSLQCSAPGPRGGGGSQGPATPCAAPWALWQPRQLSDGGQDAGTPWEWQGEAQAVGEAQPAGRAAGCRWAVPGSHAALPRQVLTVDARNHGSSPHSPVMTYEAMSLDVQQLLSRRGITKCILVGHSMGGKTAMTLALQRVSRHGGGTGLTGSGSSRGAVGRGWHLLRLFTSASLAPSSTGAALCQGGCCPTQSCKQGCGSTSKSLSTSPRSALCLQHRLPRSLEVCAQHRDSGKGTWRSLLRQEGAKSLQGI